jgi:hypothetical protein
MQCGERSPSKLVLLTQRQLGFRLNPIFRPAGELGDCPITVAPAVLFEQFLKGSLLIAAESCGVY